MDVCHVHASPAVSLIPAAVKEAAVRVHEEDGDGAVLRAAQQHVARCIAQSPNGRVQIPMGLDLGLYPASATAGRLVAWLHAAGYRTHFWTVEVFVPIGEGRALKRRDENLLNIHPSSANPGHDSMPMGPPKET